jgi:hypothetical protein
MENLNQDNVVFSSKGMKDLGASNILSPHGSLKEFEDIHNQAKSVLSKGNFSFGNRFYDSDKEDKESAEQPGNDTFDLEYDNDFGIDYNKNKNDKERTTETAPGKARKQWGRKPQIHNFNPQQEQDGKFLMNDLYSS